MLLAIDIGNTQTSVGVFEGSTLRCEFRLSTRRDWTSDEIAVALLHSLQLRDLDPGRLGAAAIACVVPSVLRPMREALALHWGVQALVVGPGVKTGLAVHYDPPRDVGADRIVAAVAAYDLYIPETKADHGIIVVDFGTATTFDVISPEPAFIGGAIAPGVGISADALFARAARLPRVDIARPPSVVGKNTEHAMQSGLLFGYVSLVEGMIGRFRASLDWPFVVVATGGLAPEIAKETSVVDHVNDDLMLLGLAKIHARNAQGGSDGAGPISSS